MQTGELVLSREQVRAVDRTAIEEYGLPGVVLMENAGRGCAELLLREGRCGKVVVCCGKGNNGGDGYVIARHLENAGVDVVVLLFCPVEEVTGDAAINLRVLQKGGTPLQVIEIPADADRIDQILSKADWVVDALLGTGAQGTIRDPYSSAIEAINASGRPVLAVDLPSGLDCDTGLPLGACIRAELTATFVAKKPGFLVRESGEWTGSVEVIDIGIPRRLLTQLARAEE